MTTLLIGFDSAWTPTNSGALVGALHDKGGSLRELGLPRTANYPEAEEIILRWQLEEKPEATIILLDQPTIVNNPKGQRPVENLVASPVSLRYGGVQPANTSKVEMFGEGAPVWSFLNRFGGPASPSSPITNTLVFETYPVLAMIALGWILPDSKRRTGRLPKYNPARKKTFSIQDWEYVVRQVHTEIASFDLPELSEWLEVLAGCPTPNKADQDRLDSCICLIVALYLAELKECLMVGNIDTGYMVIPSGESLRDELNARCISTAKTPKEWVQPFRLPST